jgi:hypothetical protein
VKGLSKKQLLKENQELREENARLRQEVELLRQKMDLLIRRMFGRSSEKLDADQLDLFLLAPENEPGKVDDASSPGSEDLPLSAGLGLHDALSAGSPSLQSVQVLA